MGICLCLVRLSDAAVDEISATPKKVLHFWMQDEAPEPAPVGFLGRLLGKKTEPLPRCSIPREPDDETDLDKAWDAIDYLLSDGRKSEGVARFLTEGGKMVPEDLGYGGPRFFRSAEVKHVAAFLDGFTLDELRARYDGAAMDEADVYPQIWERDGSDGVNYVVGYFESLQIFVREAANRGLGMMIVAS